MNDIDFYLFLDRIEINNANAISSPLTYGFPAVTGFLGAIHALQRKIPFDVNISFEGAIIACHETRVKRYRPPKSDYIFSQSRNPIKKDGKTASIIEEGKVDLTISLVLPVRCDDEDDEDWLDDNKAGFVDWVKQTVLTQRIAGGSVFELASVSLDRFENLDLLKAQLAPAFILMDARQHLNNITHELQKDNPEATALDALLEVATVHHIPEMDDRQEVKWKRANVKQGRGWLVPMPVGYQAISPLFEPGIMKDCRSQQYPSQFVETLYGLGQWVFPYSLKTLVSAFWQLNSDNSNVYFVEQMTDNSEE